MRENSFFTVLCVTNATFDFKLGKLYNEPMLSWSLRELILQCQSWLLHGRSWSFCSLQPLGWEAFWIPFVTNVFPNGQRLHTFEAVVIAHKIMCCEESWPFTGRSQISPQYRWLPFNSKNRVKFFLLIKCADWHCKDRRRVSWGLWIQQEFRLSILEQSGTHLYHLASGLWVCLVFVPDEKV